MAQSSLQILCNPYQTTFFIELEQKNLQFVWKQKRLWIAEEILRKKTAGEIRLPDSEYTTKLPIINNFFKVFSDSYIFLFKHTLYFE